MSTAFVFPGQGSQSVGMMDGLAARYPAVRATFDSASDVLGADLWKLVTEGPKDALDATTRTQPAMLAAGVATYRVWRENGGPQPDVMAGHSLGEYSALVCAGALSFEEAVALVARRSELMQDAVAPGVGAMAAVLGLSDEDVEAACAAAAGDQVVQAVNFNAPGQVVVAGHREAVERLHSEAQARGARRVLPLSVSVPAHSELMRPAAESYADALAAARIARPTVRVLHNAGPVDPADPDSIRAALARQLYSPVPWRATIERLLADEVGAFYECGPGKVLTGLIKRIHRRANAISLHDADAVGAALEGATP